MRFGAFDLFLHVIAPLLKLSRGRSLPLGKGWLGRCLPLGFAEQIQLAHVVIVESSLSSDVLTVPLVGADAHF